MSERPAITFAKPAVPKAKTVVIFVAEGGKLALSAGLVDAEGVLPRAFAVADFTGKAGTSLDLITPAGLAVDRLVAVGVGKAADLDRQAWLKLGGTTGALLRKSAGAAVYLDVADAAVGGTDAADFAAGMLLRSYAFDRYKSRTEENSGRQP